MAKKEKLIFLDAEAVIDRYKMKYYNGAIWMFVDNVWVSLDSHTKEGYKSAILKAYIGMVYQEEWSKLDKDTKQDYKVPPPRQQLDTGTVIGQTMANHKITEIFKGIVFKNGYVKTDGNGFKKTKDIPFTTCQIPKDYSPVANKNEVFAKWFNQITNNNKDIKKKYLVMWSYALSSETLGILAYSWGKGGIGKSEIIQKIAAYVTRSNNKKIKSSQVFGSQADKSGRFALRNINDKTMMYADEFTKRIALDAGNTVKLYMNESGYLEYENKGTNDTETLNTHSWFTSANQPPKFYDIDEALLERIVMMHFYDANLSDEELKSFMSGEYISYLITLLVNVYTKSAKYKATRNKYLRIDEFQKEWLESDVLKSPEEMWILENIKEIDNKGTAFIIDKYKKESGMGTNYTRMGNALKNSFFVKDEKAKPRVYNYQGEAAMKKIKELEEQAGIVN